MSCRVMIIDNGHGDHGGQCHGHSYGHDCGNMENILKAYVFPIGLSIVQLY